MGREQGVSSSPSYTLTSPFTLTFTQLLKSSIIIPVYCEPIAGPRKSITGCKCGSGGLGKGVAAALPPANITHALSGLRRATVSFLARLKVCAESAGASQEEAEAMENHVGSKPNREEPSQAQLVGRRLRHCKKRLCKCKSHVHSSRA